MRLVIRAGELASPPTPWRPEPPGRTEPEENVDPAQSFSPPVDPEELGQAAREKGLADGMRVAEECYRAKLARLESLTARLQEEREAFFDRIEPELVRLAVTIGEKVVGRELEMRPETVVELVRSAMRRLRDRETLRVSVNPQDLQRVKEAREDLISTIDGVRKLEIVEDRRIDPGGCLIESPNGTLDARIRTQLEEVSEALEELIPSPAGNDDTGPSTLPGSDQ